MGFKESAIISALATCKNNVDTTLEALFKQGDTVIEIPIPPQKSFSDQDIAAITVMGFTKKQAINALENTNNIDDAITLLLEGNVVEDELISYDDETEKEISQLLPSAGEELPIDAHSLISKSKTNFFLGIISHLRSRLANYCRYCMICHIKHSCRSEKPVVCCNPLCIFRYSEILPPEKKEKIKQVDRITICPFIDCLNNVRDNDTNLSILAALSDNVAVDDDGNTSEALLEMHAHRYLPNDQIVYFIEEGVKRNNVKIAKIENILKPELVVRFERRWNQLKGTRGEALAQPKIAYHGTAEANINSILERGLLVPGMGEGGDVRHATDNGWWGKGIYLAPDPGLSIGYCRGGSKLLICSVLMGKTFDVTNRLDGQGVTPGYDSHTACNGSEWVIFDPSQVLPCYLISFGNQNNIPTY